MSASYKIPRIQWTEEQYRRFGLAPQVTEHAYHKLPMFDNSALIAVLDEYPRKHLQAYTMGTDPLKNEEWRQVDIAEDSSGEDLWTAVQKGRIWLNLVHIEENRADFRSLIAYLYQQIAQHCPHLRNPRATHSALLISSPGAQVYYHLDAEPNMLWHIRGEKDIWLYPMVPELIPQEYLEDIYAGEIGENLPYRAEFDERAIHYRLQPGQAASWPHNAPHRIVNADMNVSLATSYYTPVVYKRMYLQLANRFILRNLGIKQRSMSESGVLPSAKRMSYRLMNKVRPFERRVRSASYITDIQLDPDSPQGFRQLDQPKLASFAKSTG